MLKKKLLLVAITVLMIFILGGLQVFAVSTISEATTTVPAISAPIGTDTKVMRSAYVIAKNGDYVYALWQKKYTGTAAEEGLFVHNVANVNSIQTTAPTGDLLFTVPTNAPNGLQIIGNNLYVLEWSQPTALRVYDITNPTSPTLISRHVLPVGTSLAHDFKIVGNRAYIACKGTATLSGVYSADLSVLNSPASTAIGPSAVNAQAIEIIGNYIYVADIYTANVPKLRVYKMTTPTVVESLDGCTKTFDSQFASLMDLEPIGNYLYLALNNNNSPYDSCIGSLDISVPEAILTSDFKLYKHNLSAPITNTNVRRVYHIVTDGRYLYLADQDATIQIVDPYNPLDITAGFGFRKSGANSNSICISNGKIFVAAGNIYIYNYSNTEDSYTNYEFEYATLSPDATNPTLVATSGGPGSYSDAGYLKNFGPGNSSTFNFYSYAPGTKSIDIRYAINAGGASAAIDFTVNGNTTQYDLPSAGAIWTIYSIPEVTLNQGLNTITISCTGLSGVTFDKVWMDSIRIGKIWSNQTNEYAFGDLILKNATTGAVTQGLPATGTEVRSEVNIIKTSVNSVNYTPTTIIACYNADHQLINSYVTTMSLNALGEKNKMVSTFSMPAGVSSIKAFVWDGIDTLKSLKLPSVR